MKKASNILILAIIFFATSCKIVGTIYPLSENSNNFIFKKDLIGKWGDLKDSSGYFLIDTVSGKDGKEYLIEAVSISVDKHTFESTKYKAFIVSIDGSYYIDCSYNLESGLKNYDPPLQDLLLPRHFIFRLSFTEKNKIEIESPDADELIKLIDRKNVLLHYIVLKEDNYLIIDKPDVLEKRITGLKKYPGLFKEKNILKKLD